MQASFVAGVVGLIALVMTVMALASATFRSAPSGAQVLAQLHLADRPELQEAAQRLERRARRWRRFGAAAGLVGGAWVAHNDPRSLGNSLVAPWAGYLMGLLVAEWTLRLSRRGPVRSAALVPRRMAQLSPAGWRVGCTAALGLTAMVAPLVRLGRHPVGVDSYTGSVGSCWATATWPSSDQVLAVSVVALAGLAGIELMRWRLLTRPAAEESAAAVLEDRRRRRISRLSDRTGIALALALLAWLANAVANGLHSGSCAAWRLGSGAFSANLYTSQLANLGRTALGPIGLSLLAASAVLMAWTPRQPPAQPGGGRR